MAGGAGQHRDVAALVLAAVTGAALAITARGGLKASDLLSILGAAVAVVAYATLGTLIVRRAGNPIGWLMLSESAGLAVVSLASTYAVLGVAVWPGALPAAKQAARSPRSVSPAWRSSSCSWSSSS
jgi:hypothetical protein